MAVCDPCFLLERSPDTVRAPDIAFVRTDCVPPRDERGFPEIAPDLAVEVRSPSDRAGKLNEKIRQFVAAGTRLLWVIEPAHRRARVFRRDGSTTTLHEHDALDGEDVLPGFDLVVAAVF